MSRFRTMLAAQLDPELRLSPGLSPTNVGVIVLILISLVVAVLETEQQVVLGREFLFTYLEITFFLIFLVEYGCRIWVSKENPGYPSRWRYAMTPAALVDLLVLVGILFTAMGAEGFLLRLVRALRILRLARLGRFSSALMVMSRAIVERKFELLISFMAAFILLLLSSTALYVFEAETQPEAFGSIPRAMWWAVATLTTVGYGDVVPITALGRLAAAFTALSGIGLIAMPTGVLAAAMSDGISRLRKEKATVGTETHW